VSPHKIELYNTFERPDTLGSVNNQLLRKFALIEAELAQLDEYAGRLSMTSGRFWTNEKRIDRAGRVDQQLLHDLQSVENQLHSDGLDRRNAQGLLGRTIFIRYLTDRGIVTSDMLEEFGSRELDQILRDREQAYALFDWIKETFNGDLFPVHAAERRSVRVKHLQLISNTLAGVSPTTGQGSLWPYKFDVIPIELISSIYEQFAHQRDSREAQTDGLHYTPVSVVNLVLDEVLRNIDAESRVLDITCGSGVFLVEALRRLVRMKAGSNQPTRQMIRKTLKDQIFGVDKSDAAIGVASFSLYLTALELDPDPRPPKALRFEPLIGRNLFVANAFELRDHTEACSLYKMQFGAIIGNPPWTYSGKDARATWPAGNAPPLPPRSQDFAFVWRSMELAQKDTRFGVVMRATPFFSTAKASCRARNALIDALAPVSIVNLSALRDDLFPTADYPAVVLFARLHDREDKEKLPLISVPWTAGFARSGVFEISPSDVRIATRIEVREEAYSLKAVAIGTPRDRLLLRQLTMNRYSLSDLLKDLGLRPVTGAQLLLGDKNDATHLLDLPLLDSGDIRPKIDPSTLPRFNRRKVHRPRERDVYRAPLVIFGEGMRNGRVPVGFSKSDIVYTESFYGISFAGQKKGSENLALAFAGILQSSFASWFLFLTASEFGIHKRKALLQDIEALPAPTLERIRSSAAVEAAAAVKSLDDGSKRAFQESLLRVDEAVCDLYGFGKHERLVISEGLQAAQREYIGPRAEGDLPIKSSQLTEYSSAFLEVLNAWSLALGRERYDAEIFDLGVGSALRIVCFAKGGTGQVQKTDLHESLNDVVAGIGSRIRLPIAERLAAVRELRVHTEDELFIIKPSSRRFWSAAAGLNDADATLGDGLEVESS
jgi:hypothetical protein